MVSFLNFQIHHRLGFHYELDSGSLLGAAKLNNFIPWDIDGDLYIPTEKIGLFDKGSVGFKAFQDAGISGLMLSLTSFLAYVLQEQPDIQISAASQYDS